jgi:hypothetical protein
MLARKGIKPHCYLFVDRMDIARRQDTDISLLTSVYSVLGRAELYSTIGVLTYASSKPPDSRTGPLEYEAWSTPRTRSLQFAMMASANDRTAQYFIAPVENHPRCRVADGEPVLPNGHRWVSHLLGLMGMFMGLSAATALRKPKSLQKRGGGGATTPMDIRRLFGVRFRTTQPLYACSPCIHTMAAQLALPAACRALCVLCMPMIARGGG